MPTWSGKTGSGLGEGGTGAGSGRDGFVGYGLRAGEREREGCANPGDL